MSPEPRIRVSALLQWNDRVLLCRHEKPGKEYWLLPGGGVNTGESLVDALHRELAEELGIVEEIAVEGKGLFLQRGGGELRYIPCLNDRPLWITALADLTARNLLGWIDAPPPDPQAARLRALTAGLGA